MHSLISLRRAAALLRPIPSPKPELVALGGIRFWSGLVKANGNRAFLVDTLALVSGYLPLFFGWCGEIALMVFGEMA